MKIIFTGGGTAGHAMVNTILIPYLQDKACNVSYIGSKNGIEKQMIERLDNITYYGISTGKLRRYLSWDNFTDIFRLLKGLFEAYIILKRKKPQLVYSSGGYVGVPVVWAAYLLEIPVILRETDYNTGLANKLCMRFAKKMYRTFPNHTVNQDKKLKNIYDYDARASMIIRPQLYDAYVTELTMTFIDLTKPVCLIIGGSSGSANINEVIWENINILSKKFNVIHLCGKGKYNSKIRDTNTYKQMEFVTDDTEMGLLYQMADIIITRSGSNAVIECLLLGKRMVCIPLSRAASRGEQMLNAKFAEQNGTAVIVPDEQCTVEKLLWELDEVLHQSLNNTYKLTKDQLIKRIENHVDEIYELIFE